MIKTLNLEKDNEEIIRFDEWYDAEKSEWIKTSTVSTYGICVKLVISSTNSYDHYIVEKHEAHYLYRVKK